MNKTGKRWICFLALLMCLCLLLTLLRPLHPSSRPGTAKHRSRTSPSSARSGGTSSTPIRCFCSGRKDWDEELLKLIPAVSKADSDEVNGILHEWFLSLGEIDYGMTTSISTLQEDKLCVQADVSWIKDIAYLGEDLSEDMQLLGPIPSIYRANAPVKFTANLMGTRVTDFSNEALYENMDFGDQGYRLLGLFRLWNAMEYYYPYLDILDNNWHDLLPEYIARMLEGKNQESYELTIASLSAKLQDAHVALYNSKYTILEAGIYGVPVKIMQAEGEFVVTEVLEDDCPLQRGDIIRELDGKNIRDILAERMEYFSVTTEKKFINKIGYFLLRSNDKNIELTISRDGIEQTVSVEGEMAYYSMRETAEQPYQILNGNIGLLNPAALQAGSLSSLMNKLMSTDGLVIDLRQYPSNYVVYDLAEYLVDGVNPFLICAVPNGK